MDLEFSLWCCTWKIKGMPSYLLDFCTVLVYLFVSCSAHDYSLHTILLECPRTENLLNVCLIFPYLSNATFRFTDSAACRYISYLLFWLHLIRVSCQNGCSKSHEILSFSLLKQLLVNLRYCPPRTAACTCIWTLRFERGFSDMNYFTMYLQGWVCRKAITLQLISVPWPHTNMSKTSVITNSRCLNYAFPSRSVIWN